MGEKAFPLRREGEGVEGVFLESFAAVVERFERDGIVSARPELSRLRTTGLSAGGKVTGVFVIEVLPSARY